MEKKNPEPRLCSHVRAECETSLLSVITDLSYNQNKEITLANHSRRTQENKPDNIEDQLHAAVIKLGKPHISQSRLDFLLHQV